MISDIVISLLKLRDGCAADLQPGLDVALRSIRTDIEDISTGIDEIDADIDAAIFHLKDY